MSDRSDDEENEVDEGEEIYGSSKGKFIELVMAGGGDHWYHYRIIFNEDGSQKEIQRVDTHGTREIEPYKKAIISHPKDGSEKIKFVRLEYECNEDEYELRYD